MCTSEQSQKQKQKTTLRSSKNALAHNHGCNEGSHPCWS
jgi:hypothetical protein